MRNFNQLFTSFLMVSTLLLAGCHKDKPAIDPDPEIITYTATYTVSDISSDFFTLGNFTAAYVDKDGKNQVLNIEKAQIPFRVTVKELKEDSKLFFDLIYDYSSEAELTKDKYTFKREVSLTVKGSNGSMYSNTIKSGSLNVSKDKVKVYLDKVLMEAPFESTVKQFISKK